MAIKSIVDLFHKQIETQGDKAAALVKRDGTYREVTWRTMGQDAEAVSRALVALGVQAGDRVNLICKTSYEWCFVDLGILGAGAITVPIYTSLLADECQYIVDNSGGVLVFTENAEQTEKFRSEKARLPTVKRVVQIEGDVPAGDDWVMPFDAFLKQGKEDDTAALSERRASLTKDSILTIIYTSGTTGKPKGVVLTHDNMLYEAEAVKEINIVDPLDVQLFWLPLAHSFARALEMGWIGVGNVMAFAESMETIRDNLGEARPTTMSGVPRLYEKFHAAVVNKGIAPGGLKAKLFTAAAELSAINGQLESKGQSMSVIDSLKFAVLKRLVFKKIGQGLSELMGGRVRFLVSGGAPLAPQIAFFFRDAGITILEGYGLTETSAATFVNRLGDNTIGTVGPPMPGTEVRIAADGEVLLKGRGVMREYWNNPEASAEVFQDGWFCTGDIGTLTSDGKLKITDRKKDIIVTAGGKNVAPQNIENLLKTHKLVSQVVVHGDKRKYLTALITLDPDALKTFCVECGLGDGSYAEMTQKPEVYKEIQDGVDNLNKELASYETIKRFKILEHDFTIESGELTPSVKVKRKVINDRYKDVFDSFYEKEY
jgi:long-chain acyl-CoA synthetase